MCDPRGWCADWSGATSRSARTTLAVGAASRPNTRGGDARVQGFLLDLRGDADTPGLWKLLVGNVPMAAWQSESFPNRSTGNFPNEDCGAGGCLFELQSDPSEHHDVAQEQPALVARLKSAIAAAQETVFSPDRGAQDPQSCVQAMTKWGGFWGPWVVVPT